MNFTLLGWNFRSTPLEVRDRISLTENEQLELVHHINDDDLIKLKLGGHDPIKVYNAYLSAV